MATTSVNITLHPKDESQIEAIKAFMKALKIKFEISKEKPIVITVEEEENFELTQEMKAILDERLTEDKSDYISAKQSINELKQKYGL